MVTRKAIKKTTKKIKTFSRKTKKPSLRRQVNKITRRKRK